jgi:hypothetical protein
MQVILRVTDLSDGLFENFNVPCGQPMSRYFGMSDRFWINLQARYDIEMEKDLLADRLDREVRPRVAAG